MKRMTVKRLTQLLEAAKKCKIAVIGDIMIDRYMWGSVSRISPEAPVPVVEIARENSRIGGAANVANNILSLGSKPVLFGVVGKDNAGVDVERIMKEQGLVTDGLITDPERPTTLKTRIIADNQHVVRADFESLQPLSENVEEQILKQIEKYISDLDVIILEDYNKGVLTENLIAGTIDIAKRFNVPVAVDPKYNHFFEYKNVTLFKPNLIETQNSLGFSIDSEERVNLAGKMLLERLECENVLITRGAGGMSLYSKDGFHGAVPTKAKKIADVSGAGDTVISTLAVILAAGGDMVEAAAVANYAASIVVGEVGIVTVKPEKLIESFNV